MSIYGTPPFKTFVDRQVNPAERLRQRARLASFCMGRVVEINDPDNQRRIKVQFYFGEEEEEGEGEPIVSDWIHGITDFAGPTSAKRGRRFGWDKPVPEIGSEVCLLLLGGDPHDTYYFGQPMYGDGDTEAPGLDKGDPEKDIDWAWRWADPSGYEEGVDVEGNYYQHIPGNAHLKIDGSYTVEVRGTYKIVCIYFGLIVIAVLRMVGAKLDINQWLRPDEREAAEKLMIETMRPGGPIRKDPGIGKVDDFNE